MTMSMLEVEAQRARWARHRDLQRLNTEFGDEFASGGLGRHVESLDFRLMFVPADPEAAVVRLDKDTMEWLKEHRSQARVLPRHRERATAQALVSYEQLRDDRGWDAYVAVHQHGGLEIGGAISYTVRDTKVFSLLQAASMAAAVSRMQVDAAERWQVESPYELLVALRNIRGATLGNFAEGWAEPGQGLFDYETALEEHVLLRRELHGAFEPESIAVDVGEALERAFGTTWRRHLARRGEHEGRLDPRIL